MITSILGRIALFISILVACAPLSIKAMDGQGDAPAGSSLISKLAVITVVPTAGFMYVMRKHYNELHAIERSLDLSTMAATAREGNFRFATWRSMPDNCLDGKCWQNAADVWGSSKKVVKALMHDAQKSPDRVYVYDALAGRMEHTKVTHAILKAAIAQEKQLFETQLNLVGQYTNAPQRIVAALAPNDNRCLTSCELALNCASKLAENADALNQVESDVQNETGFRKELVHFGGWLPTSWTIAPCYQKASRLYVKLFKAYARLCALDAAVNVEKE